MKRIQVGEVASDIDGFLFFNHGTDLLKFINQCDDDVVIVDSRLIEVVDWKNVESTRHDILHGGMLFTEVSYFELLNYCTTSWFYLPATRLIPSVNWRATAHFIFIRKEVVKQLGGVDLTYDSIHTALADLTYRALKSGASIEFDPGVFIANSKIQVEKTKSSVKDQFQFISKFIGRKALLYAKFFTFWSNLFRWQVIKDVLFFRSKPLIQFTGQGQFQLVLDTKVKQIMTYTAIIPTINRYDYIQRSIDSLINDTISPTEVIVVDQTPPALRNREVYVKYKEDARVRIFFLDVAGQSSSRNFAIEQSSNEWLLLFEDDAEAWDDMIVNHIYLLEHSHADVSTGVSLAPWKDASFIPESNRKFFLTDVLATGNAFVRRSDVLEVGGLDLAFEKGSGADDDLGKRLFLNGKRVVFNYKAIETHHKAPSGGMRTHGSWWNNKTTLLGEFPPATKVYSIQKFYPFKFRFPLYLQYFLAAKRRHSWPEYVLLWTLSPYKLIKSISKAKKLFAKSNVAIR